MKLKKWIALMLALALCAALTACGSGTATSAGNDSAPQEPASAQSGDSTPEEEPQSAEKSAEGEEPAEPVTYAPIQMNDDYTFEDPTDLDFDTRYVYVGYESCKLLTDMKNFGYTATAMYEILYTKDGEVAGEYQYFVCEDETAAADLMSFFEGQGQTVTQDGSVLYSFNDADTLLALIMTFEGMGSLPDETPESYLKFTADFNGLEEYTE